MFELRLRDEVARLTLSRPEARNAIPAAGWDVLAGALREAEGARLLVLAGAGGAFCAGADLSEFAAMRGDEAAVAEFRRAMRRGLDALAALPIPTIALVEGPCYGAGVALALACDLRLVGDGARFAITPATISISYPQQDVARLVALVGPGQGARLLFTGTALGGEEAKRIGLAEGSAAELDGLCAALLASDRASLATLKRGIALAAAGIASDGEQDAAFDRLLASDEPASRLAGRRGR